MNATPVTYDNYRIGVNGDYLYEELINSDKYCYNGSDRINPIPLKVEDIPWQSRPRSINITVPPLGIAIFKPIPRPLPEKEKKAVKKTTEKKETVKKNTKKKNESVSKKSS